MASERKERYEISRSKAQREFKRERNVRRKSTIIGMEYLRKRAAPASVEKSVDESMGFGTL